MFTYDILVVQDMESNYSVVQYLFLGMLRAGIWGTRVNVFLVAINIRTMSTASLMKRQIEVGRAVEKTARKCVLTLLLQRGHVNRMFSMNKTDRSSCILCLTM